MTDLFTPAVVGPLVNPAFSLVKTGAVEGVGWVRRNFFSPIILIAGMEHAGKSTLNEYFITGDLPSMEENKKRETHKFKNTLCAIVTKSGNGQTKPSFLRIRDSPGFCDAEPLVIDIRVTRPVFIYFMFDIRRIAEEGTKGNIVKNQYVKDWVEDFATQVEAHIEISSKAKEKLCGAAALINKCNLVNKHEFQQKKEIFEKSIRPIFDKCEPRLGFGKSNFAVFYTSMIKDSETQSFHLAISRMISALKRSQNI